jgi:hypothetical protein
MTLRSEGAFLIFSTLRLGLNFFVRSALLVFLVNARQLRLRAGLRREEENLRSGYRGLLPPATGCDVLRDLSSFLLCRPSGARLSSLCFPSAYALS